MKLALCFFACVFFAGPAIASDSPSNIVRTTRFLVDWTITCNMALGDDSPKKVFSELYELDEGAADFVAHFWRMKAEAAVLNARHDLTERFAHQSANSPKEKDRLERDLLIDHQMLLVGYYYDHAPEITAMIEMRLRLAKEGKSSTLLKKGGGR